MAKFDWVPYLEGKYLSYYQWFALIGSFVCMLISFLNIFIYLILCKIQMHQKSYKLLGWMASKSTLIDKLKTITFNATFIFLSLIPLICQALDIIYLITGIVGQLTILLIGIYLDNGRKLWNNDQTLLSNNTNVSNGNLVIFKEFLRKCFSLSKNTKKRIIINTIVVILVNVFMYKTCLCFYNSEIGYYNQKLGFGINTCLTRRFQLKESCPQGAPCQIYATIPQNPHEAIFINLHTHIDVKSVDIYYQQLLTQNVTQFSKVAAEFFPYQGLERIAQRNVHSALIIGLKPNTKYLTKVFYNNRFWTNAIFKTLPAPGDKKTPIRMINAGDSGYNEAAVNLSKLVGTMKPDIFFMGGDIAYDDNMPACAYTWDYFLGMYGRLTATLGYLMPIVATVGNHDVGLNELPGVNITVNNYGPAFHIYFPQHFQKNLDGHILQKVPPLNKRRTMFNYTFGNVHYIALDSGYMHGFDGYQKKFMIESFEANKDKIKFVNYHVPIYSVCQAFDKDPTRFLFALFHWIPNFDKYHVMAAFQNHVHSFKRTKPLVGSNPAQYGTVYMGDGAYGAIIQQMCTPDVTIDIFQAFSKKNNLWLTQITEKKVQHWAYDSQGQIIDHFVQYPENYSIGTVRGEIKPSNQGYEISFQQAKNVAERYYKKDGQLKQIQKLPYKMEKKDIIEKQKLKNNEANEKQNQYEQISTQEKGIIAQQFQQTVNAVDQKMEITQINDIQELKQKNTKESSIHQQTKQQNEKVNEEKVTESENLDQKIEQERSQEKSQEEHQEKQFEVQKPTEKETSPISEDMDEQFISVDK